MSASGCQLHSTPEPPSSAWHPSLPSLILLAFSPLCYTLLTDSTVQAYLISTQLSTKPGRSHVRDSEHSVLSQQILPSPSPRRTPTYPSWPNSSIFFSLPVSLQTAPERLIRPVPNVQSCCTTLLTSVSVKCSIGKKLFCTVYIFFMLWHDLIIENTGSLWRTISQTIVKDSSGQLFSELALHVGAYPHTQMKRGCLSHARDRSE